MKIRFLLLAVVLGLFGCEKYEEYALDTIGFSDVYFPSQKISRSIVSGEGLQISIGAYLGGVKNNDKVYTVEFSIEDSLLTSGLQDGDYELLPAEYYTLSNTSEITIEQGEYLGMIDVKFDSLKISKDPLMKKFHYAIPLVITDTNADSVLVNKGYTIIPVKLMNTYEGFYYQVGQVQEFLTSKHVLVDTYVYGDTLDGPNAEIRNLSYTGMDTVRVDGIGTYGGFGYSMDLKVLSDNTVEVIPVEGANYKVEPNGDSTWDPITRKFQLNYAYIYNEHRFEVNELLTFRNRDRDGINEWRWPGFEGN